MSSRISSCSSDLSDLNDADNYLVSFVGGRNVAKLRRTLFERQQDMSRERKSERHIYGVSGTLSQLFCVSFLHNPVDLCFLLHDRVSSSIHQYPVLRSFLFLNSQLDRLGSNHSLFRSSRSQSDQRSIQLQLSLSHRSTFVAIAEIPTHLQNSSRFQAIQITSCAQFDSEGIFRRLCRSHSHSDAASLPFRSSHLFCWGKRKSFGIRLNSEIDLLGYHHDCRRRVRCVFLFNENP